MLGREGKDEGERNAEEFRYRSLKIFRETDITIYYVPHRWKFCFDTAPQKKITTNYLTQLAM